MDQAFLALEKVVSHHFPKTSYCIGGYQESAVCVQPEGNGWVVYAGERGNRYSEEKCDDFFQAGAKMFSLLSHDCKEVSSMKKELEDMLQLQ